MESFQVKLWTKELFTAVIFHLENKGIDGKKWEMQDIIMLFVMRWEHHVNNDLVLSRWVCTEDIDRIIDVLLLYWG